MAKYVLVSFDEDADADAFVENLQVTGYFMSADVRTGVRKLFATVRGVWKKPTKFCEHSNGPWTRGKKYGWWVHAQPGCGKPTPGWANGDHWMTALGTNLLPISPEAPEYRGPGQINHPGYVPAANWCEVEHRFHFRAVPGGPCPNCSNVTLTLSPIHREGANAEPAESTDSTGPTDLKGTTDAAHGS